MTALARIGQQLGNLVLHIVLLPIVHVTLMLLPRMASRMLLLRGLVLFPVNLRLVALHLLHILFKHRTLLRSHGRRHIVHVCIIASLILYLAAWQGNYLSASASNGPLFGVAAAIPFILLLLLYKWIVG